jgi:hypothetical protein
MKMGSLPIDATKPARTQDGCLVRFQFARTGYLV